MCVRHEPPGPNSHPFEDTLSAGSAAILCTGGLDVIQQEAWSLYRTISGVRLCWELEEPKGRKETWPFYRTSSGVRLCKDLKDLKGFSADPFYGSPVPKLFQNNSGVDDP